MVLEAFHLKKIYLRDRPLYRQILLPFGKRQSIKALNSVSLCIDAGQILGVVGPNGAGKTTLLRILADILQPNEGTVKISGHVIGENGCRIRKKIGYVSSDERSFFWRLTARENLEFFAKLYGLSAKQAKKRTSELLSQFYFESKADHLFRDYSAGARKKVSVMRALLHKPKVLLLDEATNSLDPGSAKMVKDMVRKYVSEQQDCGAVWSTHRLEEISQICDKVIMIDSGKIISGGFIEDFQNGSMTEYLLKTQNMNGQFEAFCQKIGCETSIHTSNKNEISEFVLNGISQKQFSQIVSIAVKDFGAYVIFAGCIKKDPNAIFEQFSSGEKNCDSCS
jgi:ABC-2 type transport system ATP-binding protein